MKDLKMHQVCVAVAVVPLHVDAKTHIAAAFIRQTRME
jgi:hypothetical protein